MADKKQQKNSKLRYLEYYGLQETLDKLYADSKENKIFTNLYEIIVSEDNIMLAYRSIKRNSGSMTEGTDGMTIADIERIPANKFIEIVRRKLKRYEPKPVRRVEIPKPNGKKRPLGIPAMWDRIAQQCILQVLEPICEAKFHEHNYGFRPNRSAEHAIARANQLMQLTHLHYVVDIDIKGFFDNVNHSKLIKQMWNLGIRDKKVICIVKAMLKAPIILPDGEKIFPTKGTPQGGILSPLLANIVLNELDWWISSQWETMPLRHNYDRMNGNGSKARGNAYRAMRKTKLKEMFILRYADDFKIFCKNRHDADIIFKATTKWLKERLKLDISEEKSKVVNLKKSYSEFLGFRLKVVPRRKGYVVRTRIHPKALERIHRELRAQICVIARPRDTKEEAKEISLYNSMVMGIHNYYCMATMSSSEFRTIARNLDFTLRNRLADRLEKEGDLSGFKAIREKYGKSKQMRYVHNMPIVPVGYACHRIPISKKREINLYTPEGRKKIHKELSLDQRALRMLTKMKEPTQTIEFVDNRISLFAAQNGKCAVTRKVLDVDEVYCHHKRPKKLGGSDRYGNLIIVHKDVHSLICATEPETINEMLKIVKPNKDASERINALRKRAGLKQI